MVGTGSSALLALTELPPVLEAALREVCKPDDDRGGAVVEGLAVLPVPVEAEVVEEAMLFSVEADSDADSEELAESVELAVAVATVEGAEDEGVQQER